MEILGKTTVTTVTDVICNKCGENLNRWGMNENGTRCLLTSAYDSPVLPDAGLILEFALCEPCVLEISKDFKIPMTDVNEGPYVGWTLEDGHIYPKEEDLAPKEE